MKNRKYKESEVLGLGLGIGSVVLAATIGTCVGLTVGKNKIQTKEGTMQQIETTQETELIDNIQGNIELGEEKIFEPGEHYICVRMPQNSDGYNNDYIEGAAISNIPEGYTVYQIDPYVNKYGHGSGTGGYDIWFVNTETVRVIATYSDDYEANGYYTFGTVVEDNKTLTK
jgi:hypothetical protein